MKKTFKFIFVTTFILMYMSYYYFNYDTSMLEISDTTFYKYVADDLISVKELIKQNPAIYKKDIVKLNSNDIEEKANELSLVKSINNFRYIGKEFTNFDYLTQIDGLSSLIYDFEQKPSNFNKTLKEIPNLKWFKYVGDSYKNHGLIHIEDDIEPIKDLNIKHFEAKLAGWNAPSVINTYKNLETAKLYANLDNRLDMRNVNISNDSLKKLYLHINHTPLRYFAQDIAIHNSDLSFLPGEHINEDINYIKNTYPIRINVNTTYLKEFLLDFERNDFPVNIIFNNINKLYNLDKLILSKCFRPKIISNNKINIKEICFTNLFFDNLYIDEVLNGVNFESVNKLSIISNSYATLKCKEETSVFKNLTELEVKNSSSDILFVDFNKLMPSLKILNIDMYRYEYWNQIKPDDTIVYDFSSIGQAESLEHLAIKSDIYNNDMIKGLDSLKNLKNLKTLVVNYEISHMLPKLDGVNIIIE